MKGQLRNEKKKKEKRNGLSRAEATDFDILVMWPLPKR